MPFNPNKFLMDLKGKKYLPVAARLVWFRQECPDWSIVTTPIEINIERGFAIFSASIMDPTGKIISTGTKMETLKDFGDFLEKSETGSVGRALAMCGYGTQFAPEFDESHRIVDSPQPPQAVDKAAMVAAKTAFANKAHAKGYPVTDAEGKLSRSLFYAVYAHLQGNSAEFATVDDWKYAAEILPDYETIEGTQN